MFWYDGQLQPGDEIQLAVDDPGFIFGATVFSTLRVYGGNLDHPWTGWGEHCDRIHQSLQTLGWSSPDWPPLYEGALALAIHYPILRITLFADGRGLITGRALPADLAQAQTQGVTAWVAGDAYARSLPAHKTGNYLSSWLAQRQGQPQGAREAILTNSQGHWLETATGNLWGWQAGQWWTPSSTSGILPGIMRKRLLTHLQAQGLTAVETLWTATQAQQFEALAYSNCVVEVLPIHTVLNGNTTLEYNANHPGFQALRGFLSLSDAES